MTKLQNVAPYPIDTASATILPGQTIDVASIDGLAGLIAAGLLIVVDDAPDEPAEKHVRAKASKESK